MSDEDGVPVEWLHLDGGTLDMGVIAPFMPDASPRRRRVTRAILRPLWFVAGKLQWLWPTVWRIERWVGVPASDYAPFREPWAHKQMTMWTKWYHDGDAISRLDEPAP